jgi:hypothetical protein
MLMQSLSRWFNLVFKVQGIIFLLYVVTITHRVLVVKMLWVQIILQTQTHLFECTATIGQVELGLASNL